MDTYSSILAWRTLWTKDPSRLQFMGSYRLHVSNIFGVRAGFGVDDSHIFPQSVLAIIPLIRGVIGVVVTRPCTECEAGYWLSLTF